MSAPEPSPRTRPSFRPEDEALLARLEDEALVRALWASQAPAGAPELPRRAASLIRHLRTVNGGVEAVRRGADGDFRGLHALLTRPTLDGYPPELVHALAVYFGRLADAYGHGLEAVHARLRSIAGWFALGRERSYALGVATRIAGGALGPDQLETLTRGLGARALEEVGKIAGDQARTLSDLGRSALEVLERVDEACRIADLDAPSTAAHRALANRARAAAIDEALAGVTAELEEAKLDAASNPVPLFEQIGRAWVWSGRDEAVERFAAEAATPIAWTLYRPAKWAELRALLAPIAKATESLEARILADPTEQVAYAAKCAQILVFRSEAETDKLRELEFAERALALCPTHRSARLVMAHLLCERAIASLDRSTFLTSRTDLPEASRLVTRAETLFPQSQMVPLARTKIAEAKGRWGASA